MGLSCWERFFNVLSKLWTFRS